MANVSRVSGFRAVKYNGAASTNLRLTTYPILAADATAVFVGDCVKLAGTADANGVRAVTKAAVGDPIVGVVCEFLPDYTNLNNVSRPASTLRYVQVWDDPNEVFAVQTSGTFAIADVGLNANFADAGGSTATGLSGQTLDGSTKATTATLTFKTLDFYQIAGNEPGNANAQILVRVNNHQLAAGTGTLGVA